MPGGQGEVPRDRESSGGDRRRLVGTLTGLSTDITAIKVSENWEVRDRDARTLSVLGYGRPDELEASGTGIARFTDNYALQSLYGLSRLLWRGSWPPVSPTGCWRSGSVQPAP